MRDRLLIRHFLWRFLEHDLISPNIDRHVVLSVIAAALVAASLFLVVLIAAPYQFFPYMPPGIVSIRALDEGFFFTSASMVVMALVAVAQWDALALDARDTSALGVLPIPRAAIVRTKFTAVALLAIGAAVAWNLAPTLLRFAAVPPQLGVTLRGTLALTLARGVTTLAAGAFGFLAVMGLREATSALLGQACFQRISALFQASLLVALVSTLLLLPGIPRGMTGRWLARGGLASEALPPFWFVGLHETLAGSAIDDLPRVDLSERRLAAEEREATALYRSLRPRFHALAPMAVAGLVVAGVLTAAASIWNSRRLPVPLVRRAHGDGVVRRALAWMAVHTVARTSLRQAGFFFTLQTISRQVSHRATVAASLAVGLSLLVVAARGQVLEIGDDIGSVPLTILAAQSLLLASVLSGFRHAIRVPAELRAGSTFRLAWSGNARPYISGVKRAGWIALVLPTLGGLLIWHTVVLGVRLALLHLGAGVAVSALLMEVLFVSSPAVPLVSAYVPSGELTPRVMAFVAAVLFGSFTVAWTERLALSSAAGCMTFIAITIGVAAAVATANRASRQPAAPLDLDEAPPLAGCQRLDLAG
jgi:hypothetical protein